MSDTPNDTTPPLPIGWSYSTPKPASEATGGTTASPTSGQDQTSTQLWLVAGPFAESTPEGLQIPSGVPSHMMTPPHLLCAAVLVSLQTLSVVDACTILTALSSYILSRQSGETISIRSLHSGVSLLLDLLWPEDESTETAGKPAPSESNAPAGSPDSA